jgi:peptidoglycan/xylan/chitin deacetylase (PgdA/CDA1 family)
MRRSPPARALALAVVAGVCLLLQACASRAPATATPATATATPAAAAPRVAPAARTAAPPAATGEVLGRNDRLVIYNPRSEDTLESIAARFLGSADNAWMVADANGVGQPEAGQPLVVPLKPLNPLGVAADGVQLVPILCYHRFGTAANAAGWGGKMTVSPGNFAAQLEYLARNDYRVIRLSQLQAFLDGKQALPKRAVVITFDDGYESVYRHALPLLRKYNFPATLFVYTDFIGAGDAVSWAQLQELQASGLVSVQAHSKTHRNLIERTAGDTDASYRQMLEAETRTPREVLERRLQGNVRHYAYPYGDANDAVLDTLTRQQYQLAVTVNPGGNAFYAQPLMLRRTMIYGDHDLEAFKARLQTSRSSVAP